MERETDRVPVVELETHTGRTISLSWLNSVLRTYKDAQYNHVEWITDDGERIGFLTPQSVMDALFELDYPSTFSPTTTDAERDWFAGVSAAGLDEELEGL